MPMALALNNQLFLAETPDVAIYQIIAGGVTGDQFWLTKGQTQLGADEWVSRLHRLNSSQTHEKREALSVGR